MDERMRERVDHQRAMEEAELAVRTKLNEHGVPFELVPNPVLKRVTKAAVDAYQESRQRNAIRSSGSP